MFLRFSRFWPILTIFESDYIHCHTSIFCRLENTYPKMPFMIIYFTIASSVDLVTSDRLEFRLVTQQFAKSMISPSFIVALHWAIFYNNYLTGTSNFQPKLPIFFRLKHGSSIWTPRTNRKSWEGNFGEILPVSW